MYNLSSIITCAFIKTIKYRISINILLFRYYLWHPFGSKLGVRGSGEEVGGAWAIGRRRKKWEWM